MPPESYAPDLKGSSQGSIEGFDCWATSRGKVELLYLSETKMPLHFTAARSSIPDKLKFNTIEFELLHSHGTS